MGEEEPPGSLPLRAAALVGTHTSAMGVIMDFDTTGVPVAILTGDLDSGFPEIEDTYPTLEPPRALMVIPGANHFGLTDVNEPPGANSDPNEQQIAQAVAVARFSHWAGLFLRAHILGDDVAHNLVHNTGGNATVVIVSDP